MAYLTAKGIAALAVQMLSRDIVLPATVSRVDGGEYRGPNGGTITVRKPGAAQSARTQATPGATITLDSISETGVDVALTHLYFGVPVTDEDLTYNLEDFGRQVLSVQTDAVAHGAEGLLAAVMNGLTGTPYDDEDSTGAAALNAVLAARTTLSKANVPMADRYLACSPDFAELLLKNDLIQRVDASGSDNALRDAVIGRLRGFTVIESNALTDETAVAYHKSAFVFTNATPATPRGAGESATASAGGVSLRHILQYNANKLQDESVVSTFAGAAVVDANRAVRLTPDA